MITLLHQSTTEGFEGKEEESEKSPEEEIAEMEEKEMKKGASDKMKKTKKEKKSNKEVVEEEEEEVPVKEGFELIKKTEKECETYDKEGFTGFTEILKKFKIPITTTNTTDLDRELKASAERSTLDSSKEF
jgi:hypothetical protein